MTRDFSPAAQVVCEVCALIWITLVMSACTYLVFWKDQSGWWYLLAVVLAGCWSCKNLLSPAQIVALKDDDEVED